MRFYEGFRLCVWIIPHNASNILNSKALWMCMSIYVCISLHPSWVYLMGFSVQWLQYSPCFCFKCFVAVSSSIVKHCLFLRCPFQRSIPVENTLLWSSTWNTTPVMVIQNFILQSGLVYLFLSVVQPLPFLKISHTNEHYSITISCTINTVWCGCKVPHESGL